MHASKQPYNSQVTLGMNRDDFMKRVRWALGRGDRAGAGEVPVPPRVADDLVRTVPLMQAQTTDVNSAETNASEANAADANQASPLSRFMQRAGEVGMVVQATTRGKVLRDLLALVESLQVQSAAIGVGSVAELLGLGDALRRKGVSVHPWREHETLQPMFDVDVGITDVHAAIAESGTLVCSSDAGHSRGLSLVPPVHLAVVRRSDIVPDLMDYTHRLTGEMTNNLPSSTVFITGPSKTADIEGVLVTGVHGPGKVHVLVVTDA